MHYETAKIVYQRENITEEERDFCKVLNHAILYGAGEETLLKKMVNVLEPEYKLYLIKSFLSPLISISNELKEVYSNGCYLTWLPWNFSYYLCASLLQPF